MMNQNPPILSLKSVVKKYNQHVAVDHVSFDVDQGSIFGLLGPNGAGKTSLIRIITGITDADAGEVYLNGELRRTLLSSQIGYMPEERGLYKKMKVGEQLVYLAQLKGLPYRDAKQKLLHWMKKFDIVSWWDKKVGDLSKGMQQKVQFIATVVHEPSLIILDEPFSGLDPINSNLIKDEIHGLQAKGVSIIFSTHRMEQVEEICQKIVLINKGQKILDGAVKEIRNDFKDNLYQIQHSGNGRSEGLTDLGYRVLENDNGKMLIKLEKEQSPNILLKTLIEKGFEIHHFNEVLPGLNEIFIKKVEQSNE